MYIYLLFSLLIPILQGLFIIILLWPTNKFTSKELLFISCLSVGLGFGISSCLFFLWLEFVNTSITYLKFIEIATLLISGYYVVVKHFNISPSLPSIQKTGKGYKLKKGLIIFFVSLLAVHLVLFIIRAIDLPLGNGDGLIVWNSKAGFIFRAGENWREAFTLRLILSDYPMLIPGSIARGWKYIHQESALVPVIIHLLFTFSVIGLIFFSLAIVRSTIQGMLAALIILGTYHFIELGPAQYADVPLTYFFLATIILLFLHDKFGRGKYGLLVLAGITTGLAAWTKNEGNLFVLAAIFGITTTNLVRNGWRYSLKNLFYFFIGIFPILIIVIYYKYHLCQPNVFMSHAKYDGLTDISRYFVIFNAFIDRFIYWGYRIIRLPNIGRLSLTMILLVYLWLLGMRIDKENVNTVITTILVLTIMWSGYFYIYLTTYIPLQEHIDTSLNRLAMQLWTPFVFLYFMIVRPPEEVLAPLPANQQPVPL